MAQREPIRKRTAGASGTSSSSSSLPQIPDKLYFRIGEVAKLCEVPAYVLRFWEGEFPQLKPNKGGTGQRLYRRRDVEMALRIKTLLYDEGYTIPGARQAFKAELRAEYRSGGETQLGLTGIAETVDARHLVALRKELQDLHSLLSKPAVQRAAVHPIRGSRGFAQDTTEPKEVEKPRLAQPRLFPKPQWVSPKSPVARLHGLFDLLPLDD
jgi:DNA-binding transcriptional MerR regulator